MSEFGGNEFIWPVRVYYEDTDSGGVIYHANYLKFMERARTEWLRARGFEQDTLVENEGVLFVVRSIALELHRAGRFNQRLSVGSKIIRRSKVTLTFDQTVMNQEGQALCSGQVKLACVDALSWDPRPIPSSILAEISAESMPSDS